MSEAHYPLLSNFFQFGYVTSNLDEAMQTMRETHGIRSFKVMRHTASGEMDTHIALAYVGDLMVELIEPCGGNPFYRDLLPRDEFAIRHHHMGYRVHDEQQWERLRQTIELQHFATPMAGKVPDLLWYAYVDNRSQLGHYQEYIFTTAAGEAAFFGDVPRN